MDSIDNMDTAADGHIDMERDAENKAPNTESKAVQTETTDLNTTTTHLQPKPRAEIPLLLRFPSEILDVICHFLPNAVLKNLRLTSRAVSHAVRLRLTRVFLSPNPTNISVFLAVVAHPTLRQRVRCIVIDDARLADPNCQLDRLNDGGPQEIENETAYADHMARFHRLADAGTTRSAAEEEALREAWGWVMRSWVGGKGRTNMRVLRGRNSQDLGNEVQQAARAKQREAQPDFEVCYQAYMALFNEQSKVIEDGADADALMVGLQAFPMLERIEVTPATHGYLYTPLYRTPMIRGFLYGFNYPLPRGWPTAGEAPLQVALRPWVPAGPDWQEKDLQDEKRRWRGLVLMIRTLAERIRSGQGSTVTELVMDVHSLNTGVSPYMLTQKCAEYDDLALILRQPGFKRLDLPIMVHRIPRSDKQILVADGRFRNLLSEARQLQHFRLRLDNQPDYSSPPSTYFFPLQTLLPLSSWPRLRHFGLSNMTIHIPDLVAALAALPTTLRSVELSFLAFAPSSSFAENDACHEVLLTEMKNRTDWASWKEGTRPQVTMGMAKVTNNVTGRGLWFSREIGEFLYEGKQNPFRSNKDILLPGVGWLSDEYDEEFTRPYVGYKDYRALWYSES